MHEYDTNATDFYSFALKSIYFFLFFQINSLFRVADKHSYASGLSGLYRNQAFISKQRVNQLSTKTSLDEPQELLTYLIKMSQNNQKNLKVLELN